MPLTTWTLSDLPLGQGFYGITGYAVLDALGVKMGRVTGWVKDPDQRMRMIKVSVRDWFDAQEFLVPIGCITLIDDSRLQIHVRELTRRSLPKYCIEYRGELPEPQLLKSLIRYFPNPRPVVVERLERPEGLPTPHHTGNPARDQRGDGSQAWTPPAFDGGASWSSLEDAPAPKWTPLSRM